MKTNSNTRCLISSFLGRQSWYAVFSKQTKWGRTEPLWPEWLVKHRPAAAEHVHVVAAEMKSYLQNSRPFSLFLLNTTFQFPLDSTQLVKCLVIMFDYMTEACYRLIYLKFSFSIFGQRYILFVLFTIIYLIYQFGCQFTWSKRMCSCFKISSTILICHHVR